MTTRDRTSNELVDVYRRAYNATWQANIATTQGEAVELDGRAIRAGLDAVLRSTYRALRQHASAYRNTEGFRRSYEAWQADRDDQRLYAKHVIHEFFAKGLEAAARDIAEQLGVPEHEIEDAPDA